ncbi:hypothetical protein N1851_007052 [Merluccius polli]|uniref:Uncharacterized protein n=1 Tax=Merluccius polli TaxID=89951 RepID=A0AA47P9W8_MERPO|nr:hypothetical protein N1851_007052 [Merluccius polli]
MTTHMENRKETVRPKLLLTPRRPTTIATWKVRTMYAGGKTAVIAEEMRRYNLSLLGLGYRHIGTLPSHITQPVPSTTITTTPGSRNHKITGGYVERSEKHMERDMRRSGREKENKHQTLAFHRNDHESEREKGEERGNKQK